MYQFLNATMYRYKAFCSIALTTLFLLCSLQVAAASQDEAAAEADTSLTEEVAADIASDGLTMDNLWGLVGQARGFQYPIFLTLIIGLFLIAMKVYELYADQKEAKDLETATFPEMDSRRITLLVSNQDESMSARLHATMLNVFQTQRTADTLHEEISNFLQYQHDRFSTFKRRVDFLSDTAGALGLLGTVWGIFTVFSSGTADRQIILIGMGVALITTLLGLVVSIILNLSSTEVYSFFNRRLDEIGDKADELRFRLMELANEEREPVAAPVAASAAGSLPQSATPAAAATAPSARTNAHSSASQRPAPSPAQNKNSKPAAPGKQTETAVAEHPPAKILPRPKELLLSDLPSETTVADEVTGHVQIIGDSGEPMSAPVQLSCSGGTFDGGRTTRTVEADETGASFTWNAGVEAGAHVIEASVETETGHASAQHQLQVQPGAPAQYAQRGNNQGAPVGKELPKPFQVMLRDAHDNPVPGYTVTFVTEAGGGTFANGTSEQQVTTGADGAASTAFVLGDEPGLQQVRADVGDKTLTFQAMAIES